MYTLFGLILGLPLAHRHKSCMYTLDVYHIDSPRITIRSMKGLGLGLYTYIIEVGMGSPL